MTFFLKKTIIEDSSVHYHFIATPTINSSPYQINKMKPEDLNELKLKIHTETVGRVSYRANSDTLRLSIEWMFHFEMWCHVDPQHLH